MSEIDVGELFSARVLELASRAGRGTIAVSEFYSPREIRAASTVLNGGGYGGSFAFFGGYRGAERERLVCLPDYMLFDGGDLWQTAADAAADDVVPLRVSGSGYRVLSHRDFMGSILALGIKRGVLGDIIVDGDGYGAYIFCDGKISGFISESLGKVANDTVTVTAASLPENFCAQRKTEPISDTVASMRADCVVAALIRCPRERAKAVIMQGLVEVNYETWGKPDAQLESGDIVSVRGEGKFKLLSVDGMTRRGRLRLSAEKYI